MRSILRISLALSSALFVSACGGASADGPTGTNTNPGTEQPVVNVPNPWSIDLSPSIGTSIAIGQTLQLQATVRNALGETLVNSPVVWSSSNSQVASVGSSGIVSALMSGSAAITATSAKNATVSGSVPVSVLPPPRPAGSILAIGQDSIVNGSSGLYRVSTLVVIDTAVSGSQYRVGVIHTASSVFVAPIFASDFPQLNVLTECSNGNVYALDYANSFHGVQVWGIDSQTGIATNYGAINLGTLTPSGIACDAQNHVFFVAGFPGIGFGTLYQWPGTQINEIAESYTGVAVSPSGTLYVLSTDPSGSPGTERLAMVNLATGALTQVGPRTSPVLRRIVFRGNQIWGFSGSTLVRVDAQTNAATTVRTVKIP